MHSVSVCYLLALPMSISNFDRSFENNGARTPDCCDLLLGPDLEL